ncbi:MAG: T9SS type A sorting domain-containing protein, partial [Bacteroidetes bacterium]|nr:T9SS type A sorting domain-containing protein [Bacteroidota bacterium]
EYWATSNQEDRQRLMYQVNSSYDGSVIKGPTCLTCPIASDSWLNNDISQLPNTPAIGTVDGEVYFSIERDSGLAGTSFYWIRIDELGTVRDYNFTDHIPWNTGGGKYYRFLYSDRDGYVWVRELDSVFLMKDGVIEHGPYGNATIPSQLVGGDISAAISPTSYAEFDRWTPASIELDIGARVHVDSMEIYSLDKWDNENHPANLNIQNYSSTLFTNSGRFESMAVIDATSGINRGRNLITISQNDLIGGQLLTTFPLGPETYFISGAITLDDTIINLTTVDLVLSGDIDSTIQADSSGNYIFDLLLEGVYDVTTYIPGYILTPDSYAYPLLDSFKYNQDFIGVKIPTTDSIWVTQGLCDTFTVVWDSVDMATSYDVYRDDTVFIGNTVSTFINDLTAPNGVHSYIVVTVVDSNQSLDSAIASGFQTFSSLTADSISSTDLSICPGDSISLAVHGGSLGTNSSWIWYQDSCGGNSIGTDSSIIVHPTATSAYYVRGEGDCASSVCVSKEITLETLSNPATSIDASADSVCPGVAVTLEPLGGTLGTGASWGWYEDSCGANQIGSGDTLKYFPSAETTYYVRAEGNCNVTGCEEVTVGELTESSDPLIATADPTFLIPNEPTNLKVQGGSLGSGANWKWYKGDSCGGAFVIGIGDSIITTPIDNTTTYWVRGEGACNNTFCLAVQVIVGVDELNGGQSIKVYPNPSEGIFVLELDKSIIGSVLEVINLYGQLVYQEQVNGKERITVDLSGEPKGIYFIRVRTDKESWSGKVLVE